MQSWYGSFTTMRTEHLPTLSVRFKLLLTIGKFVILMAIENG
ncbi:hypothetical protein LINPERHAP1_LOCUS10083 [Linum perenne]